MNRQRILSALVLVAGFAVAYLVATNKPVVAVEPQKRLPPTVRVVPVTTVDEHLTITSQGTVAPRTQSELIPEVSGRVVWISPALVAGGSFDAGQPLLRIEDADYKNQQLRSKAALERAEVEQQHAAAEHDRIRSLNRRNLASTQQVEDAQRAARVAAANLAEARASLDQAQIDLARTELSAPFTGLVREEQVDVGQFVTRGQRVATIYSTDDVEVRLPISTHQLGFLGLPINTRGKIPQDIAPAVTISAQFGDSHLFWDGQLARLEAVIDERSRMLYAVARIALDKDLDSPVLPVGLFVQAEIQGRLEESIIRLPRSVLRDNNQVLVVDDEDRLMFRQISPLRLEHDDVLIKGGLAPGERVSVSPLQTVVQGMHVRPVEETGQ